MEILRAALKLCKALKDLKYKKQQSIGEHSEVF